MNLYFNTYRSPFNLDPTLVGYRVSTEEPIIPAYSTKATHMLVLDRVSFGDGYQQIAESGIQPTKLKLSLSFANRRNEVIEALRRFFLGGGDATIYNRRPSEYFWLRVPPPFAPVDSSPGKFVLASDVTVTPIQFNSSTLTVDIEEWFGV